MAPSSFVRSVASFDKSTAVSANPGTVLALYINGDFREFVPEGQKVATPLLAGWLPERVRKEYTVYALERGVVQLPLTIHDLHYDGLSPTVDSPNNASHDLIQPIPSVTLTVAATLVESRGLFKLLQTSPDIDAQLTTAVTAEAERIVRSETAGLTLKEIHGGQYLPSVTAALQLSSSDLPVKIQSISFHDWTWPAVLKVLLDRIDAVEATESDLLRNNMILQNSRDQEALDIQSKIWTARQLNVPELALVNPEVHREIFQQELQRLELESRNRVALEQARTDLMRAVLETTHGPGGASKIPIAQEAFRRIGSGLLGEDPLDATSSPSPSVKDRPVLEGEVIIPESHPLPLSQAGRIMRCAASLGVPREAIVGSSLAITTDLQRGELIVVSQLSFSVLSRLRDTLQRENGLRDLHLTHVRGADPAWIVREVLSSEIDDRVTIDDSTIVEIQIESTNICVNIKPVENIHLAMRAVTELNSPGNLQADCLSILFDSRIVFTLGD